MNTAIPDLWPIDLAVTSEPSPVSILRQQGYLLGQRTRNFVVGEVESQTNGQSGFLHQLYISAPFLDFRRPILKVMHKLRFYPAEVTFYDESGAHRATEAAADATQFMDILRRGLAAPQLVELLAALVAQCQDEGDRV